MNVNNHLHTEKGNLKEKSGDAKHGERAAPELTKTATKTQNVNDVKG